MRSPDEIKKGLEYAKTNCLYVECCEDTCPYNRYCNVSEPDMMTEIPREIVADALAYIQQLERERDAAVADLTEIVKNCGEPYCEYCEYNDTNYCAGRCWTRNEGFKWRGVKEE